MKQLLYGLWRFVVVMCCIHVYAHDQKQDDNEVLVKGKNKTMNVQNNTQEHESLVAKKVFSNGMTILVKVVKQIPKVCIQLWYKVGSKDEKTGEKGIAHLIEHMIFKGTGILSESDINTITHQLSGSCNAFTSYDYTGYLFNFPTQHWQEALPIMADCMQNTTFKEDHLNSEMKAVIQELKMNRDNYTRTALVDLMAAIFPDHPYHHPVIGYKQDLWNIHADDLRAFYKKHYLPNNATLVVVGDVDPEEVFALAEESFGKIPANKEYKKEQFYFNQDIIAKSITLYRDIKQPVGMMVFVTPGITTKTNQYLDVLSWALGTGKASRLHKKLVDDMQIATSITTDYWSLFDYSLFFVFYEPRSVDDIPLIEATIYKEIESITRDGFKDAELVRAVKKAKMGYFSMLESIEDQAREIGQYYLATGDENYAFDYLNQPMDLIRQQVHDIMKEYFRPVVAHTAKIAPLPDAEKLVWQSLQHASDKEDEKFLAARVRTTPVEPPVHASEIEVKSPSVFNYPKPQEFIASNGLKVLYYNNEATPKINVNLEFKAKYYYDPEDKQGLFNFLAQMLVEGTKKYSAAQLADELESRGMSLRPYAGGISMSMLSSDLEKGLELLNEILTSATFNEAELEKVRKQLLAEVKQFWDDPRSFGGQLLREELYKNHPYHKNVLGSKESIEKISREDLLNFYKKYISPKNAKMAIVGDIRGYDLKSIVQKTLSSWTGPVVEAEAFATLAPIKEREIDYFINRDQVLLCFAGLSVERKHQDYDKLLLFDQVFGGGILGSMSSRLFDLREQSGLFYTISGSLIRNANEQAGMAMVQTLVSVDRLKEAEEVIKKTINTVAQTLEPQELLEARNAIVNSLVNNFESNDSIAQTFLFLDRYDFPSNYFDNRSQQLEGITKDDVVQAVKKVLSTSKMITLKIGRLAKGVC